MKKLITIIGPTAIGKTALSIQLATHFGCDIISCDSRQFFKEMRIGTAVPSEDELSAATHHFIQNKSIFENYTVGAFEKEAIAAVDTLFQTNDYVIVVGGSGLYVDAVLNGLDAFPEIEASVRTEITHNYETFGLAYLQKKFQELDKVYFDTLTSNNPQTMQNPQRLMRFVEVCIGSGKPYSSFLNQKNPQRNFTPIIIGLESDRQEMYDRINLRVDLMMENGLLEEAIKLYPYKDLNALQTVGYRELFAYLDGDFTLDFAISEIKKNTRRFAKRQLTWFKRTEGVKWFDYKSDLAAIINHIQSYNADSI